MIPEIPATPMKRFEVVLPPAEPVVSPTREAGEDTSECPIPFAHDRILEAHYFWHAAAVKYHDPDVFRYHLSALLESLVGTRNMLLRDSEDNEATSAWVREGLDRSRVESAAFKWAIDLRNTLVHESRLIQESQVEFGAFRWFGVMKAGFGHASNPFVPTAQIVEELLAKLDSGNGEFNLGVMTPDEGQYFGLTREWILPVGDTTRELLEATAECLQWLRGIVSHVHESGATGEFKPHPLDCERDLTGYMHVPLLYHPE
jgi:hypothetical protein